MSLPGLSKVQERAIDFNLDRNGSAWFMPPGMGKTRSWLETIRETDGRVLVIAPKVVCMDTWPRENEKWGYNFDMRFLHGKNKHISLRDHVSLINYEKIPWLVDQLREFNNFPYKYVIYDEVSKMKNVGTKRFRRWRHMVPKFKFRSSGTGTPVGNHLKDLYGEIFLADNGKSLGTTVKEFYAKYFDVNSYTHQMTPYTYAKKEIIERIRDVAISFDINDLDMPPLQHSLISMDLPDDVKDYYIELRNESLIEDLDVYAVNAAVKSSKSRQFASGGVYGVDKELKYIHDTKAERLRELADELQGQPMLIFFEYIHDYQTICRVLGDIPAIYGGTKASDIPRLVRKWNAGEIPFLAVHPRSAAYGLNMQDSGNIVLWYTVPWSYELVNQGIARLWRQGQKNKVISYYLVISGTEDERVYGAMLNKAELHDEVMAALL